MSPSAERVQCPYCFSHPRLKKDGTMYQHDRGVGVRKLCPGAGKTKEDAKADRLALDREATDLSGPPDSIQPEDIF